MADPITVIATATLVWSDHRTVIEHVDAAVSLVWQVEDADQPQRNEVFIDSVEAALKAKISGLRVRDEKSDGSVNRRIVRVYYRWPEHDVTEITYPMLTIDLLRIQRAANREQRGGPLRLPYVPAGYTAPGGDPLNLVTDEKPIPVDLVFSITSWSRYYKHDRSIMMQMWDDDRMPMRFGWLPIPEDGTWRYFDLLDGPTPADTMVQGKRMFRKVWTVSVSGEWFQNDILPVQTPSSIDIDVALSGGEVESSTDLQWAVGHN